MERIDVIERAAAVLRGRSQDAGATLDGAALLARLCAALKLDLRLIAADDVMLGGAYSRLQLWLWERPELGGLIWLSLDLDPETRAFAIAHELGHWALHRGEGISLHPPCDQRQVDQLADARDLRTLDHRVEEYTPRARRELEANAFAAELLAPRALVRGLFVANADVDASQLAARAGISRALAQRRLSDAVLALAVPAEGSDSAAPDAPVTDSAPSSPAALIARLDESQRHAARTPGPALIVAGPGTGKTATLVGRVAHLVAERNVPPERVLALTFSNRAAGEMRARLAQSGLPSERMALMTIHAFAAALLREYAPRVPHAPTEPALTADFRILDEADAFLLMEELLAELPLRFYRSLGNPTSHLRTLLADFSRARDGLHTPEAYLALVDAMSAQPSPQDAAATFPGTPAHESADHSGPPRQPAPPYTAEQIARARERALAYGVWDRALRRRGLVDFGGLIQRAVELLRADDDVLAHVRARFPHVLVDEFQDTNRAAAELLLLVAGAAGGGLWVVGDRNQSIYRFRGAAPSNLRRLVEHYPDLHVLSLQRCYRSVPAIVRLGSAMAARMAATATPGTEALPMEQNAASPLHTALRPLALQPVRGDGPYAAVLRGETFVSAAHERVGLAASVTRQRALGHAYADQAVLCRTHKQVRQIAAILADLGLPVSQLGDFFDRPEIKDALMLVMLAAGPDARGVLRAAPLLLGLGLPAPQPGELAAAARALGAKRLPLPEALRRGTVLDDVPALSATTRAALVALGGVAARLRGEPGVAAGLADFLLRPQGYAWHLARVADGLEAPQFDDARVSGVGGPLPGMASAARARQALAALGELVGLARRFDTRWLREPDFRARLSRAVTHRRATPPTPDALETPPGADTSHTVTPDALAHPAERANPALEATPTAPAVRCFPHYLRALRAADAPVPVPAGTEDAVHVLTLHQSKGLEFPIVYLPGLAQGQFPQTATAHDEVCPPGFRENDSADEHLAEERCLFYVGVTRARDIVVVTRAAHYGKPTASAARAAQSSVLLDLMREAADWVDAASLHSADDLARLLADAAPFEWQGDEDEDDAKAPAPPVQPATAATAKPVFQLHELQQYLACPLQYKYAQSYDLLDPAENAVHRFHRFIRRGRQALGDLHTSAPGADWQAARNELDALWESHGPAGHAYDAFYWQAAEAILRREWQSLTAPESGGPIGRVVLAQPLRAELRDCIVELTADRVTGGALPANPDGRDASRLSILVRLHTGRPREAHKDDLALPLYYLAHQQQHPGAPVRVVLAYTGETLSERPAPPHEPGPADLLDVTERAKSDAERYLKPDRKQRSKLDKLDEAACAIIAGQFAPRPSEQRCPVCAYCYVCPADPDPSMPADARSASGPAPVPLRSGLPLDMPR